MGNRNIEKTHLVRSKGHLSKEQEKLVADLDQRWGLPFVARNAEEIRKATGVPFSTKFFINQDSLGKGPEGKVRFGGKVAYPSRSFFIWFVQRGRCADWD